MEYDTELKLTKYIRFLETVEINREAMVYNLKIIYDKCLKSDNEMERVKDLIYDIENRKLSQEKIINILSEIITEV